MYGDTQFTWIVDRVASNSAIWHGDRSVAGGARKSDDEVTEGHPRSGV